MTDIVERLRSCATPLSADMYADEMLEAAAEIERLREALQEITQIEKGYEAVEIARAALEPKA